MRTTPGHASRSSPPVLAGALAGCLVAWTVEAAPAGGYADLVERVAPAVVFIETTATAQPPAARDGAPFGPGGRLEEFFERFGIPMPEGLPVPPEPGPRMGVGSGFLIAADGTIVTNNHVVADASEVTVRLGDGRSYPAEVVGTDAMTDLALLRIEAGVALPFVSFGDSRGVRPGDSVIAVGNPFGLGGSVTSGIVSAVARDINVGPYDDFIQIDAAINRGNSGGPLFNEAGEVIGVNTAIFSPTGGSVGIGFAVPAAIAQDVIAQLDATGEVERGWLGVQLQPLTPELAEALGLAEPRGALVLAVVPEGPAAAAGLEAGDVILAFGDVAIEELRDLPRQVAATRPGESVELVVQRDGARERLSVEITALDHAALAAGEPGAPAPPAPAESDAPRLGIAVGALDEETRALAGVDEEVAGVLVTGVDPQGPAAGQLRTGDVIVSVANEVVASPEALVEAVAAAPDTTALLLRVWRAGSERFVAVRPDVG